MSNVPNVLGERALSLGTRSMGGRAIRLKINPNRFNRVALSARVNDAWVGVELSIDSWGDFCGYIEAAARSKEEVSYEIECYKSNQHHGTLIAGRDSDGLVYVEMSQVNGGKVRFEFLPLRQYVSKMNGQPIPESDLTRRRAIKWVSIVDPLVREQWKLQYKEDTQNGNKGNFGGGGNNYRGGNGGGNNYGGNGGGNYQRNAQPAPADGDLDDYLP